MCNQREALIDHLYGESDASARRTMDEHLESCAECRTDLAAMRGVQQDLLAWEVPERPSVWKPFAPPQPSRVSWRQIPAWGMAIAATAMLGVGFAGGAMAHALMPARVVQQASAPVDQAAIERNILDRVRAELASQSPAVTPASNAAPSTGVSQGDVVRIAQQLVTASEARQKKLAVDGFQHVAMDLGRLDRRYSSLANTQGQIRQTVSALAHQGQQ